MNEELELKLFKEIEKLKKEIRELKGEEASQIPIYSYSSITLKDLEKIVSIKQDFSHHTIFDQWLSYRYKIENEEIDFLNSLIDKNAQLIESFNEEELKVRFISPILNKVDFTSFSREIREFYEFPFSYKTDKFILSGTADFVVSKGLKFAQTPYFFIQEFKKSKKNDDPEPQLLAELISAVELNNFQIIRGAYIIGSVWNFVILERIGILKYKYYISKLFNSTNIDDLKQIYKNLLFVKDEIIQMVDSDNSISEIQQWNEEHR
ncbi:MAG: hypothetical protein KDK90_23605 [Leptospiraceae bacterium]|nr:hypothetical protein [Leptospiraceae bacterium]